MSFVRLDGPSGYHFTPHACGLASARVTTLIFVVYLVFAVAFSRSAELHSFFWVNAAVQGSIFLGAAHLPSFKYRRMSFVDLAWPMGLVGLALTAFFVGEGSQVRRAMALAIYLTVGLRMTVFALAGLRMGMFKREFPRYLYRLEKWRERGPLSELQLLWKMQLEIAIQSVGNMTLLAVPGALLALNANPKVSPFEWGCLGIWGLAFVMESVADYQKLAFAKTKGASRQVCQVGLWQYTRHPNYFFQWMQWMAISALAVPSWVSGSFASPQFELLGLALLLVGLLMYYILVFHTGAIPSESYSVQKRPAYRGYIESTSQFFPWFPAKRK